MSQTGKFTTAEFSLCSYNSENAVVENNMCSVKNEVSTTGVNSLILTSWFIGIIYFHVDCTCNG
jgi:hypothetical protein